MNFGHSRYFPWNVAVAIWPFVRVLGLQGYRAARLRKKTEIAPEAKKLCEAPFPKEFFYSVFFLSIRDHCCRLAEFTQRSIYGIGEMKIWNIRILELVNYLIVFGENCCSCDLLHEIIFFARLVL